LAATFKGRFIMAEFNSVVADLNALGGQILSAQNAGQVDLGA
jgi:hypothetical protein